MHPCLTPQKRRADNLEIDGRSIDRTSRTVYKWHIAIGYVQSPCFREITPLDGFRQCPVAAGNARSLGALALQGSGIFLAP
jgi:hypothetical protein